MYDRIHIDLQGLILKHAGADKGYVNWQLNNMHERTNTLVTDIFQENINYKCGLPQGINMSVELSNLYSATYIKWLERSIDKLPNIQGYKLDIDGIIHVIKSLGYVDDTTLYLMAKKLDISAEDFIKLVQAILDAAADFSLVFKVGRNPKKCTVTLYNIEDNILVPNFKSIAWSFENRGPLKASIKPQVVRCSLEGDLIKYAKNFDYSDTEIPDTVKPNRYLGVSKTAFQENEDQINALCFKMRERIYKISNRTNHPEEIRTIHNSIVNSTVTFSPLCIQFPFKKTMEIDRFITKIYSKAMSYCTSDAKHAFFITEKNGGHNVKPLTREFLCSLVRELEINLLSDKPHGFALRTSIEAAVELTKSKEDSTKFCRRVKLMMNLTEAESIKTHTNLMGSAMKLTSAYGLYLRDLRKEWIMRISNELIDEAENNIQIIGGRGIENRAAGGCIVKPLNKKDHKAHDHNLDGFIPIFLNQAMHTATNLANTKGLVDETLLNNFIKEKLQEKTFLSNFSSQWERNVINGRNVRTYMRAAKNATQKFDHDYALGGFLGVYEWRRPVNDNIENHDNPKDYKIMTSNNNLYIPFVNKSMKENSHKLLKNMTKQFGLDPTCRDQTLNHDILRISDYKIIERATLGFTRPMFIATDGSYDPETKIARASMVIVEPEVHEGDENDKWIEKKARPLLIRTYELPKSYGLESTTINAAEVVGIIIAILTITKEVSKILITDSNVAKSTVIRSINLQDRIPRVLIRNVGHHISCYLVNLMIACTEGWEDVHNESMITWSNTALESWGAPKEGPQGQQKRTKFNKEMWSNLGRNFILKIYSHQEINEDSCPNIFCTSANELADSAADITKHLDMTWRGNTQIYIPPFSNEFTFTLNSKAADKGAVKHLREQWDNELLYRLITREKQGAWFRIMDQSAMNLNQIGEKRDLKHIVRGNAQSWNRTVYLNSLITDDLQRINMGVSPVLNWQEDYTLSCQLKQCPFCVKVVSGTTEHLHMACENETLLDLRSTFQKDMEIQLQKLYEIDDSLQEKIKNSAREAEVNDRYIIEVEDNKNKVYRSIRLFNKSVLTQEEINNITSSIEAPQFLKRYLTKFPLAHKAGFISCLEEDKFIIKEASITDLSFQGILPKRVMKILCKSKEILIVKNLISTFILRSICMQRAITWLIKDHLKAIKLNEVILTDNKENVNSSTGTHDGTKKRDTAMKNRINKMGQFISSRRLG